MRTTFFYTNLHISCSFVRVIFDFFLHISQILFQFAKLPLLKLGNLVQLRFKPFIPERKNIIMGRSEMGVCKNLNSGMPTRRLKRSQAKICRLCMT